MEEAFKHRGHQRTLVGIHSAHIQQVGYTAQQYGGWDSRVLAVGMANQFLELTHEVKAAVVHYRTYNDDRTGQQKGTGRVVIAPKEIDITIINV